MIFRNVVIRVALAMCLPGVAAGQTPGHRKHLALLVGIDHYRYHGENGFSDLQGAVNDVRTFRDVLTARFGFDEADTVLLTDADATRAAILQAFHQLIARAANGDEVVFYYAGHGSTVPDPARPSGHEETIVPSDSRDPAGKIFDITDRELRELFGQLKEKTPNITAILDSCHSGTAVRGAGTSLTRRIPEDKRPQPARAGQRGGLPGEADRGIVFIAGSRDDQEANEHFAEGAPHGAMSYFLAKELRVAGADTTWRDVMDRVGALVTARYPSQEPQLEGSASRKAIFGNAAGAVEPYYVLAKAAGGVVLNGGAAHGLAAGSVFDVFGPGSKSFDRAKALGRISLMRVQAFTSVTTAKAGEFPEGSRAVEREHSYADFRFRILWEREKASRVVDAVRRALVQPVFHATEDPMNADFQVRVTKQGIVTTAADGTPLSSPIDPESSDAESVLKSRIEKWSKWFQLLALDNAGAGRPLVLTAAPVSPRPDGRIRQDDAVKITVRNTSNSKVFVSLLDMGRSGAVDAIYFTVEGASEEIPAGGEISTTRQFFVPEGMASTRDILKVFATRTAVDFRSITQAGIRDIGARDPLSRLFSNAVAGSREVAPPVSVKDWATATAVIDVFPPQ